MKNLKKTYGFTLIELLTVIAIIGILASILIPTVGVVKTKANIAASKIQLSGYVNAIQMFKGEYNYYPFSGAQNDTGGVNINELPDTDDFVETLSARDPDSEAANSRVATGGNRKQITFMEFSEGEFDIDGNIVDSFDNSNIFIVIDGDGDNKLTVPDPDDPANSTIEYKAAVTAYVQEDGQKPDYYLYD